MSESINKTDILSEPAEVDVLSLFDGMACGMLAFQKVGIKVNKYYAYEIDKYAIKTVLHNFPEVQELGDVFDEDFSKYENVDFLMGGSPCTYWSIAQSPDKRETTASGLGWELFSQYVRAIKEAKPKYFIYENNKSMAKAIYESISETFGFEPIMINSALVSAQNRQRYYWVGKRNDDGSYSKVDIEQPEDRGILLKDVLDGVVDREKSRAIIASIGRTTTREYFKKNQGQMSCEPVAFSMVGDLTNRRVGAKDNVYCLAANPSSDMSARVIEPVNTTIDGKSYCLTSSYYKAATNPFSEFGEEARRTRVVEPVNTTVDGKSQCLRATCYKDEIRNIVGSTVDRKTAVAEPVGLAQRGRYGESGVEQHYEVREDGKSNCLTTVQKDTLVGEPISSSVQVGALPRPNGELSKSQGFRIHDINAKSVTLKGSAGGAGGKTGLYAIPTMIVDEATKKGYIEVNCGECFDYEHLNSKTRRGRKMSEKSNCLTTFCNFYQYIAYAVDFDEKGNPTKAVSAADGKTYTVYNVLDGQITIKGRTYPIKLCDGYYIIRKLTVSECKRLQTVPEWYEFPVSDTQAYKMMGNGWTVDVISHLIESIFQE